MGPLYKILFVIAILVLPTIAQAAKNNIDYLNFNSQERFKDFASDLTGALAYKTIRPAEPLGLAGFDLGFTGNISTLKHNQMASVSSNGGRTMETYILSAVKGLPFDVDVGVDYTFVPASNISTWGGNISWALFDGTTSLPAIGLTGHYTQTNGIKAIRYNSHGLDLGVSKSFFNFTPYASIGMLSSNVQTKVTNQGAAGELKEVNSSLLKLAVGVNVNFLVMDLLISAQQIGEVPTYSIKAGYRF